MSEIDEKINKALLTVENPKFDCVGQVGSRRYPYASLGACMDVVDAACQPLGLSVYFGSGFVPGTSNWYVSTIITDGKEERERFSVLCDMTSNMQDRGSALTYAKRYSVSGAFALTSEADDDGKAASTKASAKQAAPKPAKSKKPIPPGEAEALRQAVERLNTAMAVFADLHDRNFNDVKEGVKKRPDYVKSAEYLNVVADEFEQENESVQQERLL